MKKLRQTISLSQPIMSSSLHSQKIEKTELAGRILVRKWIRGVGHSIVYEDTSSTPLGTADTGKKRQT